MTTTTIMNETDITLQKINNNDIIFFVGNSPTVTFNENVTVYIYPRISYIDSTENENFDIRNENFDIRNENFYIKSVPDDTRSESVDMRSESIDSVDIRNEPIDTSDRYNNKNKIFAFFKKCIKKISI
jgi:hypothetical protein